MTPNASSSSTSLEIPPKPKQDYLFTRLRQRSGLKRLEIRRLKKKIIKDFVAGNTNGFNYSLDKLYGIKTEEEREMIRQDILKLADNLSQKSIPV